MSRLIPFQKEHLRPLISQKINQSIQNCFETGLAESMEKTSAVTLLYRDQVMACAGIATIWPGRGHVWAAFNECARYNFRPVFRAAKQWFEEMLTQYHRIELSVDHGNALANRRAILWGFYLETARAKQYLPNGQDASVYVMVRGPRGH